ncbi:uncharacterized protein LOC135487619 isoform X2 [Lineus longissimus]|uniref:uncharacterized protein LOC135487619 isoform X2 n=1 Tax=Lineus longissimus TaxID=88925 RepID=UPI00315CB5E6
MRSSRDPVQFVAAPSSSRPELGTAPLQRHEYAVRPPAEAYPGILDRIGRATDLVYGMEEVLFDNGVVGQDRTSLIELEKDLLEIGAYANVSQGVYYALKIESGGRQLVRFFESGSFSDFFHHKHHHFAKNRVGEIYNRKLAAIKRHIEFSLTECMHEGSTYSVHLQRVNHQHQYQCIYLAHSYVHSFGVDMTTQVQLEEELQSFRLDGQPRHRITRIEDMDNMPRPLSLQHELDVLCLISNDHSLPYPTSRNPSILSKSTSRIGYLRYLSYVPSTIITEETTVPLQLPSSPRNRYIYFEMKGQAIMRNSTLKHFFHPVSSQLPVPNEELYFPDIVPLKKTRKITQRIVKITQQTLQHQLAVCAPTTAILNFHPYLNFKLKLVELGAIFWRYHSPEEDCFILNEYGEDGEIVPNSFCSVTVEDDIVRCSCDIYRIIATIANLDHDNDIIPDGLLCMHCRFVKEEIKPHLNLLLEDSAGTDSSSTVSSAIQARINECKKHLNDPVVRLSAPIFGTTKYSVRSHYSCSIINVSSTGIMVFCTNGACQASSKHKRSVKRLMELEEASTLCEHLATMNANQEVWAPQNAPSFEEEEEADVIDEPAGNPPVYEQVPDKPSKPANFNKITGKWDFGGYSVHKPSVEEKDINAIRNTRARTAVHDGSERFHRNTTTGCFEGLDLIPEIPDRRCKCGSAYTDTDHPNGLPPTEHFTCTLYMRQSPIRAKVFFRECLQRCEERVLYSGASDNVFLWSKQVAACDEVGWDFLNRILSSKISFSSFCDDMSRIYQSIHPASAPFMNKSTFVSWFFSWCGRMQIDFRTHIDPWCKFNPKSIAGDGTHIGMPFRNVNISPVEKPDTPHISKPNHKRFDRVFLPYRPGTDDDLVRKARKHLKNTAKIYLSCKDAVIISDVDRALEDENLLSVCPQAPGCKDILTSFLSDVLPADLKQAWAEVLILLNSEVAAVSTVIPHRFIGEILATSPDLDPKFVRTFCPELGHALYISSIHHKSVLFNAFISYLVDFIQEIHRNDHMYSPPTPKDHTYNPESGVAYYFSPHGNILRELPGYAIKSASSNHDDLPCEEERCHKSFGKVSVGGWSYLFLWFCPIHGHCYGFHVIQGAEGRKDPFASIYRYMPEPPKEVFYDFACSLSEYSLNREPDFFIHTRIWHDVFHGITHTCGKNFRSRRLSTFTGYNTEICEQFNSFLQCIKYTGMHLSQSHFCFFIQFLIFMWNRRKTDAFMKKVNIAKAGSD